MKKKILTICACVILVVLTATGVYRQGFDISDITLNNAEAIARGEGDGTHSGPGYKTVCGGICDDGSTCTTSVWGCRYENEASCQEVMCQRHGLVPDK